MTPPRSASNENTNTSKPLIPKSGTCTLQHKQWCHLITPNYCSSKANTYNRHDFAATLYGHLKVANSNKLQYTKPKWRKTYSWSRASHGIYGTSYTMGLSSSTKYRGNANYMYSQNNHSNSKGQQVVMHSRSSFISIRSEAKNRTASRQKDCCYNMRKSGGAQRGGGGGGGSSSNDSSDDDDGHKRSKVQWVEKRGEKWEEIKRNKLEAKKYGSTIYYKIKIGKEYRWFSLDLAGHAGSAFKGWIDRKAELIFESSYDVNLNAMEGKNESNKGKRIKKSEMHTLN